MKSNPVLIDDLPDLVLRLRRDGTILGFAGGRSVSSLRLAPRSVGAALEAHWPPDAAALIKQLALRAIASRSRSEAIFTHDGKRYQARANAESPECALCLIGALSPDSSCAATGNGEADVRFDRREFIRRLSETISAASLTGRPAALVIVHMEGLKEISQLMDASISDRVVAMALRRVRALEVNPGEPNWYVGQVADDEIALVVESSTRDIVEARAVQVCSSLGAPLYLGDAAFHLKPYAGAALFGQDATTQSSLVERARVATTEARRSEASVVCFFSDTMKLRSLTRIDIAQELEHAIANRDIRLRYRGRYDLETGSLLAWVGYLQWIHPIRGAISPAHFLGIAAATGLSTTLSHSVLQCLRQDLQKSRSKAATVPISFGALRHHVLDSSFVADVQELLADDSIDPECLELRISERTYIARGGFEWQSLVDAGVRLVVDEVGRNMSSIDRLARAPLWGLQLDRSCAVAAAHDLTAAKVCRAVIGIARSLNLVPIATGIDNELQRSTFRAMGCAQGSGDLYDDLRANQLDRAAAGQAT